MNHYSAAPHQIIYEQIQWIERRRLRIIDAVNFHFGNEKTKNILKELGQSTADTLPEPYLESILDENECDIFLKKLAIKIETNEAQIINAFQKKISPYQSHVNEQILYGARHAGQETARNLLANTKYLHKYHSWTIPEVYSAIAKLTYNGLPWENHFFVTIRPLSDVTVHYKNCVHTIAWKNTEADPAFLCTMQREWIDGCLDILAPQVAHIRHHSIAKGEQYGLDRYCLKDKYTAW